MIKNITIPKTLTEAEYYPTLGERGAFSESLIETAVFENGITAIPDNIFLDCQTLKNVTIPERVTLIENSAFKGCTSLQKITIPESVKEIQYSAFEGCIALTALKLPSKIEKLGGNLIKGCTLIKNITIPKTVTEAMIYNPRRGAFSESSVETAAFEDGITTVPNNIFLNCKTLKSVTIPESVKEIQYSAFEGCVALTALKLPSKIEKIGCNVIKGCTLIKSITIPKTVTEAMTYNPRRGAFSESSVETAVFEDGITTVPNNIFFDCQTLKNVTIPEGVTLIGHEAFENCIGLQKVTIPESVKEIQYSAFEGCVSLTALKLPSKIEKIGGNVIKGCTLIKSITIPKTVTEAMTYNPRRGAFSESSVETAVFEDGITTVPDNIFLNCNTLRNVTIPESVVEIKSSAFANCSELISINLPKGLKTLGRNVFQNCSKLFLYADKFSEAAAYLVNNEVNFDFISENYPTTGALDRNKSSYVSLSSSVLSSGKVVLNADYKLSDTSVNDRYILISVPKSMADGDKAVMLDGEYLEKFTFRDGILKIGVKNDSGNIKVILTPDKVGTYSKSFARLQYKKSNVTCVETIDIIDIATASFTLNIPSEISSKEFTVSGIVFPETEVSLYCGDKLLGKTVSSKVGVYSAEVILPEVRNAAQYTVTAKANIKGEAEEVSSTLRYLENTPELTDFKFYYVYAHSEQEKCIDLLSLNGKRPTTTVYIHDPMRFEIEIANDQDIEDVVVSSTKNGIKKYIKAEYEKKTGKYIAKGYFDPKNTSYVPGTLNVEYRQKQKDIPYTEIKKVDLSSKSVTDSLPSEIKNSTCTVKSKTSNYYEAVFKIDQKASKFAGDELKLIVKSFDKDFSGKILGIASEAEKIYAYTVKDENGKSKLVNIDYSDPYEYVAIVKDLSTSEVIKTVIEVIGKDNETPLADDILAYMGYIGQISGFLYSMHEIDTSYDDLSSKIMEKYRENPDMMTEKLKQAKELQRNKDMFTVTSMLMSLALMSLGPEMVVASAMMTVLLGTFKIAASNIWDLRERRILNGSSGFNINMLMDPSGYVYEAVASNRLEGVKTTIYYKDSKTGKAVKWNAEEYDQMNPLYTDDAGQYAWDVTEGLWQVKYEKDGYVTATSDWLPVPPPQLDVNIGLKTNRAPNVKSFEMTDGGLVVSFDQYIDLTTVNSKNLAVSKNGKNVSGSWTALNAEEDPTNTSVKYASIFRINGIKGDGKYELKTSGIVNYAGIKMKGTDSKTLNVGELKSQLSVAINDIALNYKKSTTIKPTIKADDGAKYTVEYSSSNTKVATVDENGKIYGAKKGSATITCTVTDSNGNVATDTCKVTVGYSFGQWLIVIVLFGWIWY